MNRYLRWGFALALLPLAGCNADRSDAFNGTVPQPMSAAVTMGAQDGRFINAASTSDQFELQASQVALQRSRTPAVRVYAQQMIDQHTTSTQQLTALAGTKGAAMSQGLDSTQQRLLSAVQDASPGTFDRTYLSGQITGHTATVASFNDEIGSGSDAEVKAFAQQNLPMIQQHLADARRLAGRR